MYNFLHIGGLVMVCLLVALPIRVLGQSRLELVVTGAKTGSQCTDLVTAPDVHYQVSVQGEDWVTYPSTTTCYQDPPFTQFTRSWCDPAGRPDSLTVCFRVFENDPLAGTCNIDPACLQETCMRFQIAWTADSTDYELVISDSLSSWGKLQFRVLTEGGILNQLPVFQVDTTLCFGDSLNLGDTVLSKTGVYIDTLIGADGCPLVREVALKYADSIAIDVDVLRPAIGRGNTGTSMKITAEGGFGNYQFTWCDGTDQPEVYNLKGGDSCCVNVIDQAGCSEAVCKAIPYLDSLEIDRLEVQPVSCPGARTGSLRVLVDGGTGPYLIHTQHEESGEQWEGGLFGATWYELDSLPGGQFTIRITSKYQELTQKVQVGEPESEPVVILAVRKPECMAAENGVLAVPDSFVQVSWSTGAQGTQLSGLTPDTYSVTVTSNQGCIASDTIDLTPVDEPPSLEFLVTDSVSCPKQADGGLSALVSGAGVPVSYEWSDGATGPIRNNLPVGIYSLTMTTEAGCRLTEQIMLPQKDSLRITELDITGEDCTGKPGSLNGVEIRGGTPPYSFIVSEIEFETEKDTDSLPAGRYYLGVSDARSCIVEQFFQVPAAPDLKPDLGPDREIKLGEELELRAALVPTDLEVRWFSDPPGAVSDFSGLVRNVRPLETTRYGIEVMDPFTGCTASDTLTVFVKDTRRIYVPNTFSPNGDGVNDELIVFPGEGVELIHSFRVFDRFGGLVYERLDRMGREMISWDGRSGGSPIPVGVYIYVLDVSFIDGSRKIFKGDITLPVSYRR